jgi:hypothetical protein
MKATLSTILPKLYFTFNQYFMDCKKMQIFKHAMGISHFWKTR